MRRERPEEPLRRRSHPPRSASTEAASLWVAEVGRESGRAAAGSPAHYGRSRNAQLCCRKTATEVSVGLSIPSLVGRSSASRLVGVSAGLRGWWPSSTRSLPGLAKPSGSFTPRVLSSNPRSRRRPTQGFGGLRGRRYSRRGAKTEREDDV